MIKRLKLEHILFLDIETVPQFADYDSLDNPTKLLWEAKPNTKEKRISRPRSSTLEQEFGQNLVK